MAQIVSSAVIESDLAPDGRLPKSSITDIVKAASGKGPKVRGRGQTDIMKTDIA
jgi:hypothetical protein